MKRLLVVLLLVTSALAQTPAKELVANVLKNPGYFSQNCNIPPPLPAHALPLFGYHRGSDTKISPENFTKLRAQRSEVVKVLAVQIDALNPKEFKHGDELMMMVLDLNAVETLSSLLRLEKAFGDDYKQPPAITYPPHVQVLSTITAILKNEKAAGLDKLGPKATFDKATRDRIVALAEAFLKNVDPGQWRRGKAMTEKPEYR